MGHAAATAHRRAAGHQHPQHVVAALARLAEAGEPLSGPGAGLRGAGTTGAAQRRISGTGTLAAAMLIGFLPLGKTGP